MSSAFVICVVAWVVGALALLMDYVARLAASGD